MGYLLLCLCRFRGIKQVKRPIYRVAYGLEGIMSLVIVQICFTVVHTRAASLAATAPAAGALCIACRQYAVVVASLGVFMDPELCPAALAW